MFIIELLKSLICFKSTIDSTSPIEYWVNDPSINLKMKTKHKECQLPINVSGYKGGGHLINTSQGRSANCYIVLNNCIENLIEYCPKDWALKLPLNIYPMAGLDLNAYYDRKSIKYFYFYDIVEKKNIYLCESADVVTHELGHAILDALRPDFWSVQSYEIWALHEAFSDFIAIISILNNKQILKIATKETSNNLLKSNPISRLAEHFAKTLYNVTKGKKGIGPESLRDAVNDFIYIDPKDLPEEASHEKLSKECHSFGRIMTGCLYEILIEIYNYERQFLDNFDAMQIAKNTMVQYLFISIKEVPCTNKIFKVLCKKIIQIDKRLGSKYSKILNKVFKKRNLLSNYEKLSIQNFQENKEKIKKIKVDCSRIKNLYVDIPSENKIEYESDGTVSIFSYNNLEENIDYATMCVESLYYNKMIGDSFKIKKNNLFRKKIIN